MKIVKDENGGSLIEFAIIAPVLFLILFGIIEFGILIYDNAMITNASREGARAGIVYSFDPSNNTAIRKTDDEIIQVVRDYCEDHLISFGSGTALAIPPPTRTGDEAGDSLTVTVNYSFRFLVFSNVIALIGGDLADNINLSAQTIMRLE
jgi:Flp pilus assembly protein TadG